MHELLLNFVKETNSYAQREIEDVITIFFSKVKLPQSKTKCRLRLCMYFKKIIDCTNNKMSFIYNIF